jgi:thioredoxin-like negative regulator of GroEL
MLGCAWPGLCESPFLARGIDAFNKGQYSEAIGMFGAAKATESDNPTLHYYMANCLVRLNSKADAIREYKLALDLAPQGKMTEYCQSALRALGALPPVSAPVTTNKVQANQEDEQRPIRSRPRRQDGTSQQPQVVSVLCGCPLCHRVDMIMTDLHSKYGDKVGFIRTMQDAQDEKSRDILSRYPVRKCPTVMMFDDHGQLAGTYSGVISEVDLNRAVELAAKYSPTTRFESPLDQHLAGIRNSVVGEVEARISADQIRVDAEISKIQNDTQEKIGNIPRVSGNSRNRSGYWAGERSQEVQDIQDESQKQIKAIQDDFEKRKRDWNAAAEEKIRALQSTQSTIKPDQPKVTPH